MSGSSARFSRAIAGGLVRSMRACVAAPSWLDALKVLPLAAAALLLRLRALRPHTPEPLCIHGFRLAGGAADCTLNLVVAYRREFEPVLSRLMLDIVQPDDLCVDLGANVGYFSLLCCSRLGPRGHVIAVEALPGNARRLQANVGHNSWQDRVSCHSVACAEADGFASFFVNRYNDMHGRLFLPKRTELDFWLMGGRKAWREIAVPTRSLSSLLGSRAADVRILKIDVEGAESLLIEQALQICTHPDLHVAVELKPAQAHRACEAFQRAGFVAYDLCNDYRWLLNVESGALKSVQYAELARRTRMCDLLFTRRPLPAHCLNAP